MTDEQFKLAIKGLRMKAKNREIAYRLLVKKETRKQLMEETGIQNAYISQLLSRIGRNFDQQLKCYQLVCKEWVVHQDTVPLLDVMEREHLRQYLEEKPKKKKIKSLNETSMHVNGTE